MAYVITTKHPIRPLGASGIPFEERQIVDTLAEVVRVLNATGAAWTLQGANGESGEIPLPNGTIIEVRKED